MASGNRIDSEFGERVRAIREGGGITQAEVVSRAVLHGVAFSGVSALGKIERGERGVSFGEGVAIMRALGVSFDDLVETEMSDLGDALNVVALRDALTRIEIAASDALKGNH